MQDVVTVPAADARDAALIAQHGVQLPAIRAVRDQLRELLGGRLGAELRQRAVVALGEHPPPRLALGAELLHEQPGLAVEPKPDERAPGLRRGRRFLEDEPPALGEMDEQAQRVQLEDQELAAPGGLGERASLEVLRAGRHGLERRERQRGRADEAGAGQPLAHPFRQRLDLGDLRHVSSLGFPDQAIPSPDLALTSKGAPNGAPQTVGESAAGPSADGPS